MPAQLLGNLIAEGFGTLCVIRPDIDVHESPTIFVGYLAAQPVDFIVVPIDFHQNGTVNQCPNDLPLLQAGRDKDKTLETRFRRMGSNRVGEVPGRGA